MQARRTAGTLAAMGEVVGRQPLWSGWAGKLDRLPWGLSWRSDVALPVVVGLLQVAAGIGAAWHHHHQIDIGSFQWALLVAGPLALVARRHHPVAVLWVTFAATLGSSGEWAGYLSLIVAFFTAATGGHRRAAWTVAVVGYVCSNWLGPLVFGQPAASLQQALFLAAWLTVLVVVAEIRRMYLDNVARAKAARQLEDQHRASAERLRIARDLHDVIGHNISLINVQAAVGLDLMDSRPEQARASLAAIKTVSKEALDELRTMLVALRQAGEDVPRAPAPGLERLPELLDLTRAAGLSVTEEVTGDQRPVPPAVAVAAYRIVQESLTNVARHAGLATALVRLSYQPEHLLVEVVDDGRAPNGKLPADNGGGSGGGSGSGIAGMRERAATVGGRLDAGPLPGGGFAVVADLPLAPSRPPVPLKGDGDGDGVGDGDDDGGGGA
jgi:signal transduction histidine kinase